MAIEIKAADVMKLRKMTGAGMMDCKKALVDAEGDYERAKEIIKAGTPVTYDAAARTFAEATTASAANGYLYNDIYLDNIAEGDVENAATGAIVMYHAEGLLIDNTALSHPVRYKLRLHYARLYAGGIVDLQSKFTVI